MIREEFRVLQLCPDNSMIAYNNDKRDLTNRAGELQASG
jgi:hypothetical protein